MPRYVFICDGCQNKFEVYQSMNDDLIDECPECGDLLRQDYSGRYVQAFKPYVDIHTTGEPVEITSSKQRDAFHAAHGVTLDSANYVRRKPAPTAASQVTPDDVIRHVREKGPIRPTETADSLGEVNTRFVR